MDDFVGITFLDTYPRWPRSLMKVVPGSVVLDKKTGEAIPGRLDTFKLTKGKFHPRVPRALAEQLLNGPDGMLKTHVHNGMQFFDRAFVEGDKARKGKTESLQQQVATLQENAKSNAEILQALKSAGILDALVKTGALSADTLSAAGLASEDAEEDETADPVYPVKDPAEFSVASGDFMRDAQGALLCPLCKDYATQPVSNDYPEKRAKQALNGHMVQCRKKLNAASADES